MVVETRSQRKQSQSHYLQRPPYPQISTQSATSPIQSSFQSSSSSVASTSSPSSLASPMSGVLQWNTTNMPLQQQQQQQQQTHFSAPLPSPSAGGEQQQAMTGYFGATAQHTQFAQSQRLQPSAQNGQGPGQRSGTPETSHFLKEFGLLAEAAKRAEMACIERDLGECWL